jgi:phage terminase Nu1 subunit (DNA packaging protein)
MFKSKKSAAKKDSPFGDQEVSVTQLADALGVAEPTVYALKRKGIFTSLGGGRTAIFQLRASIAAYVAYKTALAAGPSEQRYLAAKSRKMEAAAAMAEINLARIRGQTHSSDDVKFVMGDFCGQIKSKLLSFLAYTTIRLAMKPADEIRVILQELIYGVLRLLKEYNAQDFYNRNAKLIPWLTDEEETEKLEESD